MDAITKDTVASVQQQNERKQLLCRFHVRGKCRDGERCQFSHDPNSSVPIPDDVCWYYLRNHCAFGNDCRFTHVDAVSILSGSPPNSHCPPVCPQSVTPQPQQPLSLSHLCSTTLTTAQQPVLPTLIQQTNDNNSSNNDDSTCDNVSTI